MHRCLRVPEIALLICEHVSSWTQRLDPSDDMDYELINHMERTQIDQVFSVGQPRSAQLFALAQTCRQLQQPALQSLWNTIHSITPIIKSVGGDLVLKKEKTNSYERLQIVRPISHTEAATMKKYASLVRHLYTDGYSSQLDTDGWTVLRDTFIGNVLFPNLQTLAVSGTTINFPTLFGIQDLASLIITGGISQPSMLVEYSAQCPGLRSLQLRQFYADESEVIEAVIEALPNWPNLSRIISGTATPKIMCAISHCPGLRSIQFSKFEGRSIPTETGFTALQGVDISTARASDVISFMDALPSTGNLKTLALQNVSSEMGVVDEKGWLTLLQSIRKYTHTLTELSIIDEPLYHEGERIGLSNALFATLATFTALMHVKIVHCGDYSFSDEGVKSLTEALPLLKDFRLFLNTKGLELAYQPRTTVMCLTYFARNCPHLTDLAIPFNPEPAEPLEYPEFPVQGLKLMYLDVSVSPLSCRQEEVANFILLVFPNIRWLDWEWYHVYHSYEFWNNFPQVSIMRCWSSVSKILKEKIGKELCNTSYTT